MPRISAESYGLPKPIVGWIVGHATKNYWRVSSWYELDDLINDGLLKAYQCKVRYPDVDPPHFMALVKTSFYRHITEMLRHSRGEQEVTFHIADAVVSHRLGPQHLRSDQDPIDRLTPPIEPDQEFATFISQMPGALRRVVELYLTKPEQLRKKRRVLLDGEEETESQMLKRLAGFPIRHDFEQELRAYFWESNNLDDEISPA